ncbi:hypothetical protein V8C37DRAFT_191029 [Trichoderma ceciliae]
MLSLLSLQSLHSNLHLTSKGYVIYPPLAVQPRLLIGQTRMSLRCRVSYIACARWGLLVASSSTLYCRQILRCDETTTNHRPEADAFYDKRQKDYLLLRTRTPSRLRRSERRLHPTHPRPPCVSSAGNEEKIAVQDLPPTTRCFVVSVFCSNAVVCTPYLCVAQRPYISDMRCAPWFFSRLSLLLVVRLLLEPEVDQGLSERRRALRTISTFSRTPISMIGAQCILT